MLAAKQVNLVGKITFSGSSGRYVSQFSTTTV